MTNPLFLLSVLIGLVASLRSLSAHPKFQWMFKFLPLPFWCYMIPMLLTTLGWFPAASPLYNFLSQQLLPVCLVLLLIGTDLKAIARLGPLATGLMLTGSLGTILGGLASFSLYHRWLPPDSWAAVGALAGSWIGGSANLLAVKEALHAPDSLMAPIILVDALVAYSWMALLIASSALEDQWNQWTGHEAPDRGRDSKAIGGPSGHGSPPVSLFSGGESEGRRLVQPTTLGSANVPENPRPRAEDLMTGIGLSILLSALAQWTGRHLPTWGTVMNPSSWTILLVTTTAVLLSLTRLRKIEEAGVSRLGTFALYVLLASIGARANFQAVVQTPAFLALGVTWILFHGLFLLVLGGLLFKAPLGLIATASQANIGGPISAPIVGATFSSELATVGLALAILGNLLGTYLGLLTALLARAI